MTAISQKENNGLLQLNLWEFATTQFVGSPQ